MTIEINEDGMYVDPKKPNILLGSAFKEKDTSLIQEMSVNNVINDTWIKIDSIVQ